METKYLSQVIASTDVHAGGLLFAVLYIRVVEFQLDGVVRFTKQVVDPLRPMDSFDIAHLNNFNVSGKYFENSRGYLECHFESINQIFVGLISKKNPKRIVFHCTDTRLGRSWGDIYDSSGM